MRRIEVRSSTICTFGGEEVIIPNSMRVSDRVINWTLNQAQRTIDTPVRAVNILMEVAASHAEVLRTILSRSPFSGFGDSYLDLLLKFWAEQDMHFSLRS